MVTGLAVDDAPSLGLLEWYARRARGGVGLVIVEACAIAPEARLMPHTMGIWEDGQIPGLAKLAEAIHAEGVPALLQLVHGGARAWREDPSAPRLAPSEVPLLPGPPPWAMSEGELEGVVRAFAQAARRAKAAGFDGVEVHAAHYYLLSEFLSPFTNHRTDPWGGSRENRLRLLLEVVKAVRFEVGPDFILSCRMHALERFEGGLSTEDAIFCAQGLEAAGVDLLNASGIGQASFSQWEGHTYLNTSSVLPKEVPGGTLAPATGRIKAALKIPVIAVGKLAEPGLAQGVLDAGQADLVALARQLIADPDTPTKLLEGRDDEIRRCRQCLACFASIRKGPLRCSVNRTR